MRVAVWLLTGAFLLVGSIWDIKVLALPVWLLRLGCCICLFSVGFMVFSGDWQWWEVFLAFLPGGFSGLISITAKEQVGHGDSWVLCILGGTLGVEKVFGVWFLALLASFVVSVVLLLTQKAVISTKLPFVPFLFLGYLLISIGGI